MAIDRRTGLALYRHRHGLQRKFLRSCTLPGRCFVLLSARTDVADPGACSYAGDDACGLSPLAAFLANRDADYPAFTGTCAVVRPECLWSFTLADSWLILLVSTE